MVVCGIGCQTADFQVGVDRAGRCFHVGDLAIGLRMPILAVRCLLAFQSRGGEAAELFYGGWGCVAIVSGFLCVRASGGQMLLADFYFANRSFE